MSIDAQQAKAKGNAAFKAGDFADAVGHYSAAIFADRTDFTLPLNRAAAYLKLGKNEDAERDCTKVIELNPTNPKAFFRRGSARLALNKYNDAIQDFTESLKLEPANEQVKEGLKQAKEGLAASLRAKRSKPIDPKPKAPTQPTTKSSKSTSSAADLGNDLMKAVSSRTLNSDRVAAPSTSANIPNNASSTPPTNQLPTSPPPTRPASFKDVQKAREKAKPSRIVPQTIETPTTTTPAAAAITTTETTTPLPRSAEKQQAITLNEFTRRWNSSTALFSRWTVILSVPSSSLPSMFGACLEPTLLLSILSIFSQALDSDISLGPIIVPYLLSLTNVSRFSTITLFLSTSEKQLVRNVITRITDIDERITKSAWTKL